jgi:hypothetical protein
MSEHAKYKVDLTTKHTVYFVSKTAYTIAETIKFVIHLALGVWLANIVYNQCLFNSECNNVAVTFFCILALACFANCGLPIEQLTSGAVSIKK